MQNIEEIKQCIDDAKNICIISHDGPDADAIGSSLALKEALLQCNKNVTHIIQTTLNDSFKKITKDSCAKRLPKKNETFDLVFILDCSYFDRIKHINCNELGEKIIVIDHHISDSKEGDIIWRENVQATGVLIYKLLKGLNFEITSYIATCLLLSIRGDTNNFRIYNDSFDIHQMASELMHYKADITLINDIEKYNVSVLKLIGKIFNKLVYNHDTKIAYLIITKDEIDKSGSTFNDASHIIDILKNVREIDVIYLIIQNKNRISIKARSEKINVGEIMEEFGGGGHGFAAGVSNFYCKDIYEFMENLIMKTERKLK